ncbi:MAG: ABC transporter substrate-binding protein [Cyclobacteriaceae bacterium]|jgi:ABC-type amino acid transport substrate-binding protein|nr:ABC transporter substrate-binding protein [Cyclobacteriaceae bacterium]
MKKILLLLFAVSVMQANAQKHTGDSWAKVKSAGGTLTVIYYEQPGLIYKDEASGKMKGVCADILEDFTKFVKDKYGKTLTVNYAAKEQIFPNFLSTTQNTPNIMGITNVTITDERKKILKFTPSFMSNPVVMLTHKDAPTISSLTEIATTLNGYSAKVISGSTHVKVIEKIKKENVPALKVSYANSGGEILKELSSAPKFFTVLDFTEYIDATRKQLPVKRQNVNFGAAEELGFIMGKQTDWDLPWNEFLTADYRKSVRYRKIIVDNLGANFLGILK